MSLSTSPITYRVLLFIASITWGTSFIVIKQTLEHLPPAELVFARFLVASILLFILVLPTLKSVHHIFSRQSIVLGLLLSVSYIASTLGVEYTSASNATFLASLTIIFVPLLERVLFKHKIKKQVIMASVVTIAGVILLTESFTTQLNIGDLLIVATAVVMSLHLIHTEYMARHMEVKTLLLGQFLLVTLASGIFAISDGMISLPTSTDVILPIIYLALFPTMMTYMIITAAERHIPDTEVAIILSFQGIFALLLTVILGIEMPSTIKLSGVVLITLGFIVAEYHKKPRKASKVRIH